ncbi:MAG: acid phosphatase [Gammaproteobacteria bacterium]|nr:acid phosphatase [Gammaproteobacteria bacterium]
MPAAHASLVLSALLMLGACASAPAPAPVTHDPQQDLGLLWVKHAAEYRAITTQVYRNAEAALPDYINDSSWSAMPEQSGAEDLPPAVILDVDETVVSNVDFQLTFERPFANHKLDDWSSNYQSLPIPGVKDFVDAARAKGVAVFFVTNRPCERIGASNDPCPQKQTTIDDIREVGIAVEPEYVMLSGERPGWDREKLVRRELIAKTHRVIMLIGDDYGDFVPCARKKVVVPCTVPATRASRAEALKEYDDYWGAGWYILPNPMHGSWTSVR